MYRQDQSRARIAAASKLQERIVGERLELTRGEFHQACAMNLVAYVEQEDGLFFAAFRGTRIHLTKGA